jgi:hypothetical protein
MSNIRTQNNFNRNTQNPTAVSECFADVFSLFLSDRYRQGTGDIGTAVMVPFATRNQAAVGNVMAELSQGS